jgi:hypothetical protein
VNAPLKSAPSWKTSNYQSASLSKVMNRVSEQYTWTQTVWSVTSFSAENCGPGI